MSRDKRDKGKRSNYKPKRSFAKNRHENRPIHSSAPIASSNKAIADLLSGIGRPEPSPFVPDSFQLDALAAIEHQDVLVTASTGSGKTWIAREEIRRLLENGKRAWYTTPLKALTNSKYIEFIEAFGADNVGILTGDRKENSSAPVIVGTTEIYRNMIFDAMRGGDDVRADLVVLDEAHYLSDEDRGHVWEESIILSPKRVRMLLLSATVGRSEELAAWIGDVRGGEVKVITAGKRPVELRAAYLSSDLNLYPLFGQDGGFNRQLESIDQKQRPDSRQRRRR